MTAYRVVVHVIESRDQARALVKWLDQAPVGIIPTTAPISIEPDDEATAAVDPETETYP